MKLSIRTSWFISICTLLLILLGVGFTGLKGIREADSQLSKVVQDSFMPAQLVAQSNISIISWNRSILNHLLHKGPKTRKNYEVIINSHRSIAFATLNRLSKLETLSDREKTLVRNLEENLKKIVPIQEKIVTLSNNDEQEEARNLIQFNLTPLIENINNEMREFTVLQNDKMEKVILAANKNFDHNLYIIISVVIVSVILAMLIFYFYTRKFVFNVHEIVRVAREVSDGNMSVRANVQAENEIGEIANEINRMLTKILEAEELRDQMVHIVSHELRTPLTIMKLGIDEVLEGIAGEVNDRQRKLLTSASNNIDRLVRTANDLLDIGKIKATKKNSDKTKVDAKEVIKNVVITFQPKAKDKGVILKTNLPNKNVFVIANTDKLSQVLTNLVSNAFKFTHQGFVEIGAMESNNHYIFYVEDSGIGMGEDSLDKIFDRFEQTESAKLIEEKGSGLGLFITKEIIESFGGKITVESKKDSGTKFIFTLPKWSELIQ